MPNIGPVEIIVVLAIVLLIFGPKRLPGAGRALGQSMREFKDSISGSGKSDELPAAEPQAPAHEAAAPAGDPQGAPRGQAAEASAPTDADGSSDPGGPGNGA